MARVALRNLTKGFGAGAKPVLRDLSLEVSDGEFVVLLGPSGCGKTTALRCVAGLESPDSGEILIGDRDVTLLPPAERDVAMVFQNYALYPHLTARQNIAFPLEMRGLRKAEVSRRVQETAARLGLGELLDRRPGQLSGGQRQRVALGRAIVRAPQVFLFDEPLSNLDARLRVETRAELLKLHRALGATMVYVTHDQVEAMSMADRVILLSAGRITQNGTPADLYECPASLFVARFIGTPPMNILALSHGRDGAVIAGTEGPIVGPASLARPATMCTRPRSRAAASCRASARACGWRRRTRIVTWRTAFTCCRGSWPRTTPCGE